jgi:two-component system, cell cycle sensor histidine kinase and response regulator CckA
MGELIRLLLVEDDEQDAELIRLELERGGFDLMWRRVASEIDLRKTLAQGPWDIIISDFAMPGFDGLRAFQVVQQLRIEAPFIFVSGALGEERAVEAMRAGARDYLLKDNLARLCVAVRRELSTAQIRNSERQLEAISQKEQRRLGMAVEASGVGIFEYGDASGASHYLSPRLLEILGYEEEPALSHLSQSDWLKQLIHSEDLDRCEQAYGRFFSGDSERFSAELRVRHSSGRWVDVAVFAKAVSRDQQNCAHQIIGVVLDLTERRKLESQLRQAQKMEAIGRLAGGVAHDFNNLLTAIYSFTQFAMDSLDPQSEPHEDLQEVTKAARRAQALTSQLLAFSRRQVVAPRVISANDLIQDLQRMLSRVLGEDVAVITEFEKNLGLTRIDPGSLEQVIMNLTVNARDALPDGGKLAITTSNVLVDESWTKTTDVQPEPGYYTEICVADNGVGMDETTLARMFEPFFTTKGVGKGTGLGLSTCYGIIQQARGHIWAESAVSRGTTFHILLPQTADAPEQEDPSPEATGIHGTETVLVVEDEEQLRRLVTRTLSGYGYRILEARNGREALALFEQHPGPIELLLTDVIMPDMGGKELAEILTSQDQRTKVLFMSGYAPDIIEDRWVSGPNTYLLDKPFTPERLGTFVRRSLDA